MRSVARAVAVTTTALLVIGFLPGQGFAAGAPAFQSSSPVAGSAIKAEPTKVSATFDVALSPTSSISVAGPGAITCTPDATTSGTATVGCNVGAGALTEGLYTATYAATSQALPPVTTNGTFTFTLDKTPPAAPTALTISPSPYTAATKSAGTIITVTGKAEAASSVTVSLTSSGGGTPPTPVTITAGGTGDFTAPFANSIADGTLTASATATDKASNTGPAASTTAVKDTVTPSITSSTPVAGGAIPSLTGGNPTPYDVLAGEVLSTTGSTLKIFDGDTEVASATTFPTTRTIRATTTSALPEGTYTAKIVLVDAVGNTASEVVQTFTVDNTKPAAPVITAPGKVNKANQAAYAVSGTGEADATVTVTVTGTAVVSGTTTVAVNGTWTKALNVSTLTDGTVAISATQTDGAGNESLAGSAGTTKDVVIPRVTAQAFDKASYNAVQTTATVSGTIDNGTTTAGEADAYTVSVDDAGNAATAPVVVSGTAVANGTFTSPSIDLSTFTDGTVTATIVATDASANPSAPVTATANKDTSAPVMPTVTVTNPINNANKTAVVVSGKTDAGASVTITLSDTAATTPVTATVTADGSGNYTASGLNVSTLVDGVITATVVASDALGNPSAPGTATATKDTVAPTAPTLVVPAFVNATTVTAVPVSGTAQAGVTILLSVTDGTATPAVTGTATAAANGSWSTTLDVHTLADGTLTVSATARDAAGNTSTPATGTTTKDTAAPGTPATLTASPSPYLKAQAGTDLVVSGTTAAADNAATGLLVDLTISDTDAGTADVLQPNVAVTSGAFTYTFVAARIATLTDSTLTISAKIHDAAGNLSAAKTASLLKDTTALAVVSTSPSTPTVMPPAAVSGTYNEVLATGTSTITVKNKNSVQLAGTTSFSADGRTVIFTPSSAFSEASSPYSVVVHGVDTNDAADTQDASFSFTVDNTPPAAPVVTAPGPITTANQAAYVVSGTGEAGATVHVTLVGGVTLTPTALVAGNGSWTLTVNASTLSDGTVTLTATQSDAATNSSPATAPVTTAKDTVGAAVTGLGGTNTNTATPSTAVTGATEALATVALSADDGTNPLVTGTGTVAGDGTFTGSLNLSSLVDGTITITAIATDAAGNAGAPATTTVTKDTGAPVVTGLSATAVSFANPSTTVTGSTSAATDTVALSAADGTHPAVTGTATVSSGGAFTGALNLSSLNDGTITVTATPTDSAGNPGAPATTELSKDGTAPTVSSLAASVANTATPSSTVTGTRSETSTVVLTLGDGTTTVTANVPSGTGAFSSSVNLSTLADGSISVTAVATDPAGNSTTSTTTTKKDTVAPVVSSLAATATNVGSPSTTITGSASEAASLVITATDSGSTVVTKTISAGAGGFSTTLNLATLADGTITIAVTPTDVAGNPGTAVTTTTTKSTAVPGATGAPTAVAGDKAATVTFTAVPTATSYTVTSAPGGVTKTGSGSPITITGLANGTSYTFTVTARNSAGNAGAASPASNAVTPYGRSATFLNLTPAVVKSGTVLTLKGTVTRTDAAANFGSVVLRVRFDSGATSNLGAVTPAADGTFSKAVRATYNGTYTATYNGDAKNKLSVSGGRRTLASVAISATFTQRTSAASTLTIKASVAPNKANSVIFLTQVMADGSRKLLGKHALSATSAYAFAIRLPRGAYRLELSMQTTPGNTAGAVQFTVFRN